MKSLSAVDAKNRFSDLLDAAADHPVRIDRNGKPAAYVVSAADFESVEGATALARIERLLEAKDPAVASTLRAYSEGKLSRCKALERLVLRNYAQLLSALDRAGLGGPQVPADMEEEMIKGLERQIHG